MKKQIRGLFVTTTQVIKFALSTGQIIADREMIDQRLEICRSCEFLTGSKCLHCGCNMPIKVGLIAADCPVGKWDTAIFDDRNHR